MLYNIIKGKNSKYCYQKQTLNTQSGSIILTTLVGYANESSRESVEQVLYVFGTNLVFLKGPRPK